jgi:lipid-binding SYLF domain-containing protein
MKRSASFYLVFLVICMGYGQLAFAEEKADADVIVNKSSIVIQEMMLSEDRGIPLDLIKKSAGLAIIPDMIKGGFVVGGSYGKGVVLAHKEGKWTGPAFIHIGAGSFGLQIGVQSTDLILVVIGKKTMDSFLKAKFKLGGDVAMAAGPVGAQATGAVDILLKGGIYSYSRTKGLFAGISLEGAAISTASGLNRAYYETTDSTDDILYGKVATPATGKDLVAVLHKIK